MKLAEEIPGLPSEIIRDWKSSPELRAEFGDDVLRFAAYRSATAQGLVRTVRSTVVVGSRPSAPATAPASIGDGIAKLKKDGKKAKKGKKNDI
jgi:hypothetical protein